MPAVGMKFQPREELLTDEELIRLVGLFVKLGINTRSGSRAASPTVRPHLVDIIREIKRFPASMRSR